MKRFAILKRSHALKNPRVISEVLKAGGELGKTSNSLNEIVKKVLALKG